MNAKLASIILGGVALGVCGVSLGDISGTGEKQRRSSIALLFADAPVDSADAVVVTVNEIQLLPANGGEAVSFIQNPSKKIDLLQLQGGITATVLDHVETSSGSYAGVRVFIDAPDDNCSSPTTPFASYISIDGTDYPLVVAAGATNGLALRGDIRLAEGQAKQYVVDFDLRRAVAERGQTGCYNLRPAARIVDVDASGAAFGTINGRMFENEQCLMDNATGKGAAVYVYAGANQRPVDESPGAANLITTANLVPSSNGYDFNIAFLPAGAYTLALTCQSRLDDPDLNDRIQFLSVTNANVRPQTEVRVGFSAGSTEQAQRRP